MDPAWVSAAGSGVMAVIWLVYLNLFFRELKSQYRVRVFVQQQGGFGLDSLCSLINLSDQPVGFVSVQLHLAQQDSNRSVDITGVQMPLTDDSQTLAYGAVRSGESISLGSFARLLDRALPEQVERDEGDDRGELRSLESFAIRLVMMHGGSDDPVAIERRFEVEFQDDGWNVVPCGNTVQWGGRRGRRIANDWTWSHITHRGLVE